MSFVVGGKAALEMERGLMHGTRCLFTWGLTQENGHTSVAMNLVAKVSPGLKISRYTKDHTQEKSHMCVQLMAAIRDTPIPVTDSNTQELTMRQNHTTARLRDAVKDTLTQAHYENTWKQSMEERLSVMTKTVDKVTCILYIFACFVCVCVLVL